MISKTALAIISVIFLAPIYAYAIPGTIQVDVDGTVVDIPYDAEGVEIKSIEADTDEIELLLEVEVTGATGTLEITFDRTFFDSKFAGDDDEFFVIADGDFVDLEEIVNNSEIRTLLFDLPAGTEEVEIFGTILAGKTFGETEPVVEEPPVIEEPVVEEPPVIEEPVVEEPPVIEEPVVEEPPVIEEPVVETPPPETEEPQTECGPGTVLQDGICVLDKTCGPGTTLVDGECVLDTTSAPSTGNLSNMQQGTQFVVAIIATFIIALGIMTVLWIISRGSRRKNKQAQA